MHDTLSSTVTLTAPSLPKGGGAIQGLGESLNPSGPTGTATLTLPLPISTGRGYAPALTLTYSSGAGNGPFGLGWQLNLLLIQRRTRHGVPRYDGGPQDEFLGPDGEVLVSERDAHGQPITASVHQYGSKTLNTTYQVTRYFPRVERAFDRIEYWQGTQPGDAFWLIHGADGQLHCLGKTPAGRIANPANTTQIAEWRIEESVNPLGEHIYYQYRSENTDNVNLSGNEAGRDHQVNRYLIQVAYGNRTAAADLYLWDTDDASDCDWLFSLVFDYGERGGDSQSAPPYAASGTWPVRADSFSHYQYGFEFRTHRLCRQVLLFHHFPQQLNAPDTLISRLLLTYHQSPVFSLLTLAQSLAYEADSTLQSLPPLELGYSGFSLGTLPAGYQVFEGLAGLNDGQRYQLVDLYGEGLPGVLYRAGSDWRYRAPIRGQQGGDSVEYGAWQPLPAVPSMQPARPMLMDFNGDGRLDWLVTQPGLNGYFTLREDKTWSNFMPFAALPPEFFHPQAQLADLVGTGLSDLALIGPNSVRLYMNCRDGFSRAEDVAQDNGIALPVAGRAAHELIAFSDVLGSGQPHLVRVRYDGVTCWPNLGRGRFGKPITLATLNLAYETFNPDQVFLADLDGSGASDLIYFNHDSLTVYLNQSGNGFAAPVTLPLLGNLTFDRLCQVSFADLQGLGVASLVITYPHMTPTHWRLDFARAKPYLLTTLNNNRGAQTELAYRSSAQYWLDDKQAGNDASSSLPMPIHTLAQVSTFDEITGNTVSHQYGYHHGVYDGVEREFRGFGLVTVQDTPNIVAETKADPMAHTPSVPLAPPLLTKTWYHTGRENDEHALAGTPYRDAGAVTLLPTRLTRFDSATQQDTALDAPNDTIRWWLFRALKGQTLRQEVYGLEGSAQQVPYSVSTWRYQVRQVQARAGNADLIVLPGMLEQVSYHYERIAVDPVVNQQVVLQRDQYGNLGWQVTIAYPRRPKTGMNPYPDTLPATSWASSYDDQQQNLHLSETRAQPIHLDATQAWRLGLPSQQRTNVLIYPASAAPAGGLNYEALIQTSGLLGASQPRTYTGQQKTVYVDSLPALTALVDHVETAEFDDTALAAYDGVLDTEARAKWLTSAGYQQAERLLPPNGPEPQVWVAPRGYTVYLGADGFYRPKSVQPTKLTGPVTYDYDDDYCALTRTTDALNNQITAAYDYRFLVPWQIVDINANTHEVKLDALGRVVASSFYGTEQGQKVGFSPVSAFSAAGLTVEQAIEQAGTQPQVVANFSVIDTFSWMGQLTEAALRAVIKAPDDPAAVWNTLQSQRFITAQGQVLAAGHAWAASSVSIAGIPDQVRSLITALIRMPVHFVTLTADRYANDTAQQVGVNLAYFDGLGRTLQAVQKVPPGDAWQRDAQGEIVVDSTGKPVSATASTRWAVSGKVEYDNKGQPVRSYQPYFINDWRYVADKAMRSCGYADTHYYDATGREIQVLTAKGYLRRTGYYPWFTVAEDENDTWQGDT